MKQMLIDPETVKQRQGLISTSEEDKAKAKKVGRVLIVFPTIVRKQTMLNTLPPLGILGIASFLEARGIPVDVADFHVTTKTPDFNDYDVICFSVNIANVQNTAEYIREIREKGGKQKILIGGPANSTRGKHWIDEHGVDAVFIGESEHSMYEYLTADDKEKEKVKGVILNKDGKAVFTGMRPVFQDLKNIDDFPFPALDKVPVRKYNSPIKQAYPISTLLTSRGCPEHCTFCYARAGVWRQRSVKNVVDEIEWQNKKLGVKEFWIADDNFTLNRQRAWDIAEEILKRGLKVKMQCKNGIRVDKVDKELLAKLKEAGLWMVAVAPESGRQETLERIKKRFTLERVEEVVKWCKEVDMKTCALFIVGLPWETMDHINDTLNFALKLDTDFVQFSRYTPIEGTPLYDEVKAGGMLLENEYQDIGTHLGTVNYEPKHLSREKFAKFYKKAYRKYYLRPRKVWNILRILSPRDIYYSAKFAFASGSM